MKGTTYGSKKGDPQRDRELVRAEKEGMDIETFKKSEHTNKGNLDNRTVARLLNDDEDIKVPVVSYELKIAIQQGRTAKGWNQEQLAMAISESKINVKGYQNGSLIPSGATIVRMEKAMGCKLPRPEKKKLSGV